MKIMFQVVANSSAGLMQMALPLQIYGLYGPRSHKRYGALELRHVGWCFVWSFFSSRHQFQRLSCGNSAGITRTFRSCHVSRNRGCGCKEIPRLVGGNWLPWIWLIFPWILGCDYHPNWLIFFRTGWPWPTNQINIALIYWRWSSWPWISGSSPHKKVIG